MVRKPASQNTVWTVIRVQRTQFTFYESFYKAINRIKKKADRADAYDIICLYALTQAEPDLDSVSDAVAIAFELLRPVLDKAREKAESGKKGGSKPEATGKETGSKPEATGKLGQTATEKEVEVEKEIEVESDSVYGVCTPTHAAEQQNESCKKPSRFSPPTAQEVADYCRERGNQVDAQRFVDYYTANGWRVGKNPMKDWKAAVRTWEKQDSTAPAPGNRWGKLEIPKGSGQLGAAELEAIRRVLQEPAEDWEAG
nr:MAG TPA: hypothetical protein [Caudoviricetes sp.]